jgi:hypothetical protein
VDRSGKFFFVFFWWKRYGKNGIAPDKIYFVALFFISKKIVLLPQFNLNLNNYHNE